MPDGTFVSDAQVIDALRRAPCRDDGLVMVGDLCFALGARRETIEPILRELESRGIAVCTPSRGPIAVVGLTDGAKSVMADRHAEVQQA